MGLMDKLKGMVNPDSIDDNYDDDYVFDGEDDTDNAMGYEDDYQGLNNPQGAPNGVPNTAYQQPRQQYNQQGGAAQMNNVAQGQGMSINTSNTEIKVVRPERFDAVQQIADHLINRRTVVLNLELTNKEDARHMIDFLSGVVYSINGNLRKVANNTFVITPNNVDVSAEAQQQQQQINPDPYSSTL